MGKKKTNILTKKEMEEFDNFFKIEFPSVKKFEKSLTNKKKNNPFITVINSLTPPPK